MATTTVNADSSAIKAFPAARRINKEYYQDSRVFSEKNITTLTNRLTNGKSFIMSNDLGANTLEMNIDGYYFTISGTSSIKSAFQTILNKLFSEDSACAVDDEIIAEIVLKDDMLNGQDLSTSSSASSYSGLNFWHKQQGSSEQRYPDDATTYLIVAKCIVKDAPLSISSWEVPVDSLVKFDISSFAIDGGELSTVTNS